MKKGFFHNPLHGMVFSVGALVMSIIVTDARALTVHSHAYHKTHPKKVFGGNYAVNRLKGSSRKKFMANSVSSVRLMAKFPRRLGVSSHDVVWDIRSAKGRNHAKTRGKTATASLAPGKYYVTLKIGDYTKKDIIHVRKNRNVTQTFSLPVSAGVIKAKPSSPNSSLTLQVKNAQGKVIAKSGKGRNIRRILPAGTYTVEAIQSNRSQGKKRIKVKPGSLVSTTVKVAATREVKLRALKNGNEPLLKPSRWVITNSKGIVVKRANRHTVRMDLSPGSYTAKVKVNGKTKTQRFQVTSSKQSHTVNVKL